MNIMMLLEMAASGFGDRTAVGSIGQGLTYAQLFDRAGRTAALLQAADTSHAGLVDVASPALPTLLFGSAWAGVPFVPMNYRLDDATLQGLVRRIAPATVVAGADYLGVLGSPEGGSAVATDDFANTVADTDPAGPEWSMDAEDLAVLLFTSGTTGEPKAAMLRHKHLVSYIMGSVEFMGAGEDEATLVSVPPYHIAGLSAILSSVFAGRRIVQLPQFDADAWIDTALAEGVTHAMVVPTMLARIVERLDARGETIATLRALSYGGGKMPQPVIERALELLPTTNFVNAYGLTETSSTIALLGPDEHRAAMASDEPETRARLSSAGKPLPTIELSIRDEEGAPVPDGEPGEIWVRGEQVSGEYVGQGAGTDAEGWFCTRDGGWLDDEGYLFVTGRLDDVIIRGGENISPGEIESSLLKIDGIREAAAVGVPDDEWGEVVGAVVVPAAGTAIDEAAVREHVRTDLRSSKVPAVIVVRDELPYNDTGKLLRRVLRSELADTAPADDDAAS